MLNVKKKKKKEKRKEEDISMKRGVTFTTFLQQIIGG